MEIKLIKYYDSIDTGSGGNTGALIAGTSQLASTALGAYAQASINKRTQQYNWDMFDAVNRENIALSDRTNNYNTPANQMARFKAAGLNPNLIYGQGNPGNSPVVSSATAQGWNPKAPDYSGIGGAIGNAMSVKLQQQQLDNQVQQNKVLQAQTDNINADTQVKLQQAPNIGADTNLKTFSLQFQQATQDVNIAIKNGELNNLTSKNTFTLDENQRQAISNIVNVQEGLLRLGQIQASTALTQAEKDSINTKMELIRADTTLKNLDIDFIKRTGNTGRPGDSGIDKIVEFLWGKFVNTPKGTGKDDPNAPPSAVPNKNLPPNVGGYIIPDNR